MGTSGPYKLNIDHSDDNSEYKAGFRHDVLYLIVAGHERLMAGDENYSDTAEEEISGELARHVQDYIDSLSSPDWTKYFCVQEELRENTNARKGKYRKRVDIAFVLAGTKPQKFMRFEAKRLRKPGFAVGGYIGEDGLGEFIAGNYAASDDTAGMLGYVQSDDCDYWAMGISETLEKKKQEIRLIEGGQWQKTHFDDVDHCYKTRHDRPRIKRELLVYHLLLALHKTT